jgi:hypothetical protein
MAFSAPILQEQSTFNVELPSVSRIDNLEDYLRYVNDTLTNPHFKVNSACSNALSQLQQTLTSLEVAQIRQTAIEQQIWDFFSTHELVIKKMLSLAQVSRHHRVLEPSAGRGDLANAIGLFLLGSKNIMLVSLTVVELLLGAIAFLTFLK